MKKCILVVLAVLAMASTAQAENFVWASDYRMITQFYPDTDLQFYLKGDTIDNNSSCHNRFVIRHTDPNYKVKVATLLTAWENDRAVKVKFDDADTSCGTDVQMFKAQ